nr:unnamed protein product [Callosobruchus chinensis]
MLREAESILDLSVELPDSTYLNKHKKDETLLLMQICKLYLPKASAGGMFSIRTYIISVLVSVIVTNLIIVASNRPEE